MHISTNQPHDDTRVSPLMHQCAAGPAGQPGEGKQAQARPAFLKKRSKRRLPVLASAFADGLSPDNHPIVPIHGPTSHHLLICINP
jgi:hypothetical protein